MLGVILNYVLGDREIGGLRHARRRCRGGGWCSEGKEVLVKDHIT